MISTGFLDLDRLTGGWEPGEFIVLAARPTMGKSSLLLSFLEVAARENENAALLYSFETKEEVDRRLLSHLSGIPLTALGSPDDLRREERDTLEKARDELDALLLLVNDSPALTVSDLHHWILFETGSLDAAQFQLTLVAVDYLQLMQGEGEDQVTRQEEVSEILRGLKVLSRDLEVPLIVTAQLPRAIEERDDRRPVLTDLGHIASIEWEPDKVIFIYRDGYYDSDSEDAGAAEIIVAKNDSGDTGTVHLKWRSETRQFLPLPVQ